MNLIKSLFALFGTFYLRILPASLFWIFLPPGLFVKLPSRWRILLPAPTILISLFVSLSIFAFPLVWVSNLLARAALGKAFFAFFLSQGNLSKSKKYKRINDFPPIMIWVSAGKRFYLLRALTQLASLLSVSLVTVGLIEAANSFFSHSTPDWLDFLFPESGAGFLWGGLALMSICIFILNTLISSQNIRRWKNRKIASQKAPKYLRSLIAPTEIFNPYFFLSQKGKELAGKKSTAASRISNLFKKAWQENLEQIPDEWLI